MKNQEMYEYTVGTLFRKGSITKRKDEGILQVENI